MARCSECVHGVREAEGCWCAKLNGYSLNGDHEISCGKFEKRENDIVSQIGLPAALEQLAEECAELGQAALKLARKMRGENPTPKTHDECMRAFNEETADVMVCLDVLVNSGFISNEAIESEMISKKSRWEERLNNKE